jgi:hypothetical protein
LSRDSFAFTRLGPVHDRDLVLLLQLPLHQLVHFLIGNGVAPDAFLVLLQVLAHLLIQPLLFVEIFLQDPLHRFGRNCLFGDPNLAGFL